MTLLVVERHDDQYRKLFRLLSVAYFATKLAWINLPLMVTVGDEPQVLNAVERDLRQHFHRDYRIVKAGSGQEALDATRQLKQRGVAVALFLSDQRMPNMPIRVVPH